jgi:hypothetical protein
VLEDKPVQVARNTMVWCGYIRFEAETAWGYAHIWAKGIDGIRKWAREQDIAVIEAWVCDNQGFSAEDRVYVED